MRTPQEERPFHMTISPEGTIVSGNDITCVLKGERPPISCREPHADDFSEEELRVTEEEIARQAALDYGIAYSPIRVIPKGSMPRLPDDPQILAQLPWQDRLIYQLTYRSVASRDQIEMKMAKTQGKGTTITLPWYHRLLASLNDQYVESKKKGK